MFWKIWTQNLKLLTKNWKSYRFVFKINGLKYPIALGVAFTATLLAYIWFSDSRYFAIFSHWTENNLPFLYFSVFFIKILGVIWPPLPRGVFTIAMVNLIRSF